jgi:HD-like signal output (HDOD) protein
MQLPVERPALNEIEDEAALDAAIVLRVSLGSIDVPPLPRALLDLQALGQGAGTAAYVDIVARDPALAVRVLRVANSARYGRAARVVSLHEAVNAVGIEALVRIALVEGLAGAVGDGPMVGLKDQLWRQAVSGALLSSSLAPGRGLSPDVVFVCGLLHDFGRLIAVKLIEEIVGVAAARVAPDVCASVVERYHAELGIVAAQRWELPELIRECIKTHDRPPPTSPNNALLDLVSAVDRVVQLLETQGGVSVEDIRKHGGFSLKDADVLYRGVAGLPGVLTTFTIERLSPVVRSPRSPSLEGPADSRRATPPRGMPLTASPLSSPSPSPSPSPRSASAAASSPAPAATPSSLSSASASSASSLSSAKSGLIATTVGGHNRQFEVVELTPRVILRGGQSLATGQIFCLSFAFAKPLEVWLRIGKVQGQDDEFVIEAAPFALTGEEAAQWWREIRTFARSRAEAA